MPSKKKHARKKKLPKWVIFTTVAVICAGASVGTVALANGSLRIGPSQPAPSSQTETPPSVPPSSAPESSAVASSQTPESSAPQSESSAPEPESSAASSSKAESSSAETGKESTAAVDFSGAVFLGDSRTETLQHYKVTKNANFVCHQGLMVNTVFTRPVIETKSGKTTAMKALALKSYEKVFVMFGTNELGWSSVSAFEKKYGQMLDAIRDCQPKATIYVQAILPVSAKKSASDKVYNNPRVKQFNEIIERLAKDRSDVFVPVGKELVDANGALPEGVSADGIHPEIKYCRKWARYLKEFSDTH